MTDVLMAAFLGGSLAWGLGALTRVIADEREWWARQKPGDQSWETRPQQDAA